MSVSYETLQMMLENARKSRDEYERNYDELLELCNYFADALLHIERNSDYYSVDFPDNWGSVIKMAKAWVGDAAIPNPIGELTSRYNAAIRDNEGMSEFIRELLAKGEFDPKDWERNPVRIAREDFNIPVKYPNPHTMDRRRWKV